MDKIAVFGLGNPGKEYQKTRHNIGFMAIDRINKKLNLKEKKLSNSIISEYNNLIFVKPQTYMNNSGRALAEIKSKYNIKELFVIYDEIDLDLGRVKFKRSSSSTHNGIRSIQNLESSFIHVRLGIGKSGDLSKFVLGKFTKEELIIVERMLSLIEEAILKFENTKLEELANEYNRKV